MFFLAIALISCTGSKQQFEWVKVSSTPYLQNQTTTVTKTDQNLEPRQIQITVYLKEKSEAGYFESSEEFFKYHNPADTADKNFDKKSPFVHKPVKTSLRNSKYIYRDEDIEESKLNSGLKELGESAITKNSQNLKTDNEEVSVTEEEQNLFDGSTKQLLFLGGIGLIVSSLLAWMLFKKKTKNTDGN